MENLLYNISQVLGITIIHSLWQGLLIYVVLRAILLGMPSLPSVKKYNLSAIALLGIAAWFVYTFCAEATAYNWSQVSGQYPPAFLAALNFRPSVHESFTTTLYNFVKSYLPYISILYSVGLLINLSKLGLAWNKIRIIKKGMISADNLQERINEICQQLNISRYVKVSFSRLVDVPCVIGYVKPILLLPITLTFKLSAEEIETILLHELSHIKGNDYLVNIIQQIISVLLFFNPFAQLINQIITTEREHRCDDIVVQNTQNPLTYAYALLKLEETRNGNLQLALAATQNKHHLLTRIERIMKTKTPIGNIRPILLAVLLVAFSLSSIAWLNPEIKNGKVTFRKLSAPHADAPAPAVPAVSAPSVPAPVVAAPVENVSAQLSDVMVGNDTIRNSNLNDTTKKKIKIVVEDENGNKKEYNSIKDMPESVRKDFYEGSGNDDFNFGFRFNDSTTNRALARRFNSTEYKKQMETLQNMSMTMAKKMNDPEMKKHMEAMKDMGIAMEKRMNDPEFKKRREDMNRKVEEMVRKTQGPEWKKMQEDMARKGEEMAKYYDGPEWKKRMEDMNKSSEEMAKYYDSPEFKKEIEEIAKKGAEFGTKYINTPEFKKMQEDIVKQAEEMGRFYGGDNFRMRSRVKESNDERDKRETDKRVEKGTKKVIKADVVEKKEVKEKPQVKEKAQKKEVIEKKEVKEKPDSGN